MSSVQQDPGRPGSPPPSDPRPGPGAPGSGELPRAVCLVSGGMDSAVTLAEARARGFEVHALSFDYGQRARVELEAALEVARSLGARDHRIVKVDLSALGGSALTDDIDVPRGRDAGEISTGVPVTYVPARNTVFLSVALGWAETLGARELFLGVNAVDYSGYPDCRPEFLAAFESLAALATAAGAEEGARFRVHAPLQELSKAGIVTRAGELGVDLSQTLSCYDPLVREGRRISCGACDACRLRLKGFREAGLEDPIEYVDGDAPPVPVSGARPLDEPVPIGDGDLDGLARLLAIVERLRAPDGCPWDLEQTVESMASSLVEEAFEAVEAIERLAEGEGGGESDVVEELGDLLMVVCLIGKIASQSGRFDLGTGARAVSDKLVRRHPHVFGDVEVDGSEVAIRNWEKIKQEERRARKTDASALAGVPVALPALQRADRLAAKSISAGFRWSDIAGAFAKLREEVQELDEVLADETPDPGRVESELGDVLLAAAFLGRYLEIDPESAAKRALRRYERRFRSMEEEIRVPLSEHSLDELIAAWKRAKVRTETIHE